MDEKVSEKEFNQLKVIAKFLKKSAKADHEGYELDNLPIDIEEQAEDTLPYNESLGEFMSDNGILHNAGNLNIYTGDSEIMAFTNDQDIADPNEEPLDYTQLSNRVNELTKLGRSGIARLEARNQRLAQKIYKLQDEMNVIK